MAEPDQSPKLLHLPNEPAGSVESGRVSASLAVYLSGASVQ
jgi:hypothetical protein